MSTGGWILSVLWTVIIIALVTGGIVWLVSALGNRDTGVTRDAGEPGSRTPEASAREILDRRLASGELTVEQYRQLRETIADPAHAPQDGSPPRAASATG